jgi:hypothetical protein
VPCSAQEWMEMVCVTMVKAYPSSISWVRRSMYFSQRSPTTYATVSMRRALSSIKISYLAAREATDGNDHFRVAGGASPACGVSDRVPCLYNQQQVKVVKAW